MAAAADELLDYKKRLKRMSPEELIVEERGASKSLLDRALGRESAKEKAAREEREQRAKSRK